MAQQPPKHPLPNSYRVNTSVVTANTPTGAGLWGGEYPGHNDPVLAQKRLERLLDAGITHFINLTEATERSDHYDMLLKSAAAARNTAVSHQRIPIADYSTPTIQTLVHILDNIDSALAQGSRVYVHCWGGIGRTGTVIGCWLVRHGLTGAQALQQIAEWREGTPSAAVDSPETVDQKNMILNWNEANDGPK